MKTKKPWFKKEKGKIFNKIVPISWEGYTVIIIFLTINFFNVFYFNIPYGNINSYIGFLAILLLSTFLFKTVSKKKTKQT